jgi:signal transduction histidine kinase
VAGAHELRTPVSTLEAYLDGPEDGVATLDAETIEILRTRTRRLGRLAEDVSAASRAEEHQLRLQPVPIAPGELVAAAVAVAADRYAERGVSLRQDVPGCLPAVLADPGRMGADPGRMGADPGRMGQVLGNLLENALRHTPAGGAVTVSVGQQSEGPIRLHVRDTGEGVATEHLPHLFERFYRVDAARDRGRGGSGIGLAIVIALVEAHGGRVSATSDGPGHGATFTLTLPPVR